MIADQCRFSEQLLLLHELSKSDLNVPYSATVRSHKDSRDLDAIAVALNTGKPGDAFAAAFDKRQDLQLVLAKNGPLNPEDMAAADELLSLIGNPAIDTAMDIFPFLLRRCGVNINKRIHKLHTSLQVIRDDFTLELNTYTPIANIEIEFPNMPLEDYKDVVPPIRIVLDRLVDRILVNTTQGLDPENINASKRTYGNLFIDAYILYHSRFLATLVDSRNMNIDRGQRAQRLKRHLYKVCQYINDITILIDKAKRFAPIPYRWVTDTFTGTGEGVYNFCCDAHNAISRGLDQPSLSPAIVAKLDEHFPCLQSNWEKDKTVYACIHAELRIILHLSQPFPRASFALRSVQPIGMSKRSCFCCTVWIETYNHLFSTRWTTRRSHGKPSATWAFPGSACLHAVGADGESSVDKPVLDAVSLRLTHTLDWLFPGQEEASWR